MWTPCEWFPRLFKCPLIHTKGYWKRKIPRRRYLTYEPGGISVRAHLISYADLTLSLEMSDLVKFDSTPFFIGHEKKVAAMQSTLRLAYFVGHVMKDLVVASSCAVLNKYQLCGGKFCFFRRRKSFTVKENHFKNLRRSCKWYRRKLHVPCHSNKVLRSFIRGTQKLINSSWSM